MCSLREAQAALDARNLKYKTPAARLAQKNKAEVAEVESRELSERLEAAEKAVEKFVAKRIQPAVQKVGRKLRVEQSTLSCMGKYFMKKHSCYSVKTAKSSNPFLTTSPTLVAFLSLHSSRQQMKLLCAFNPYPGNFAAEFHLVLALQHGHILELPKYRYSEVCMHLQVAETPVSRWAEGVKTGAGYIKGVWVRLNGGGRRLDISNGGLPDGLQMPAASTEARTAATKALSLEISGLEKQLQEASKVRPLVPKTHC